MTLFQNLGPISAAVASGDLQFITSVTGSATSAINVNNCFSAAYDHYLIMRNLLGSVGDQTLDVRLRASGVDDSSANYRYQYLTGDGTGVAGARGTAQTSFITGLGIAESTSIGLSRMFISNPFGSVRTTAWTDRGRYHSGLITLMSLVHEHDLTTSYDGFSVIPGSGTITGTVYVYGLKV